ncbi:hypothetical protein, partial [Synechococcus sp. Ace-Pa]|uniref:hypothetical protein n=1 Tax=Synechococcus sp. Ace-Pa TaxID=2572902 RepID=UPI001C94B819
TKSWPTASRFWPAAWPICIRARISDMIRNLRASRPVPGFGLILSAALCIAVAFGTAFGTTPARADQALRDDRITLLIEEMGLDDIIAIMREEGLSYGAELGADMLSGGGGATWRQMVDRIYDVEIMTTMVRDTFAASFEGADPEPLITFFRNCPACWVEEYC